MRLAPRPAAVATALAFGLAVACSPDSPPAPSEAALATGAVEPPTCGGGQGPVPSVLALPPLGGGCFPAGIAAAGLDRLVLVDPEWAPVLQGSSPVSAPVIVGGVVHDSRVSTDDFPSTHLSIDQNTDILLDAGDASCLATGNLASAENPGAPPTLELEWETAKYPAWAWAGPGDRIVALGRWIFDCGHPDPIPGTCAGTGVRCVLDTDCTSPATCVGVVWNYRSEIHPPQAVAVIRTGRGAPMPQPGSAGATKPIPVTRADVFVSGDGGGAGDACVVTHRATLDEILGAPCFPLRDPLALQPAGAPALNAADFTFDVPLPSVPHAGVPFWRVEQRPTPSLAGSPVPADVDVTPVLGAEPHLRVAVRMTRPVDGTLPTGLAATLFAGWRQANAPHQTHVRVTVEGIAVHDPLKPTLPLGVPTPDGWRAHASVNGEWQALDGLGAVAAAGFFAAPAVFDAWLPTQGRLEVHAQAASLGCQDAIRGQTLLATLAQFGFDQAKGATCLFATPVDGGEVDAVFAGPDFGARAAAYEVASGSGAYALRFRIERDASDALASR
jgi:hypothetical protein